MELSVPPAHRAADAAPCVTTTDRAVLVHLHVGATAGKVQSRGRMWGVVLGKLVLLSQTQKEVGGRGGGVPRLGWFSAGEGAWSVQRKCQAEHLGAAVEGSGSARGLMPNRVELPH